MGNWLVAGLIFGVVALLSYAAATGGRGEVNLPPVRVDVEEITGTAKAVGFILGHEKLPALSVAGDIDRLVIEADRPPSKFQVVVHLRRRIDDAGIEAISQAVKNEVGPIYERVFVAFRVPDWTSSFWVRADWDPYFGPGMKIVHFDR